MVIGHASQKKERAFNDLAGHSLLPPFPLSWFPPFFTWSMHGMMKKRPGPTAPPRLTRPSLKMTARYTERQNEANDTCRPPLGLTWYSCTWLITQKSEMGKVRTTRRTESTVRAVAKNSPQTEASGDALAEAEAPKTSSRAPLPAGLYST